MTAWQTEAGYYEQHYEALRREAFGPHRAGEQRGHGLALFLSQGMVAWMKALAAFEPLRSSSSVETIPCPLPGHPKLFRSIRGELTAVLAGMVLACSRSPSHE
jgi:hypothetical protein